MEGRQAGRQTEKAIPACNPHGEVGFNLLQLIVKDLKTFIT